MLLCFKHTFGSFTKKIEPYNFPFRTLDQALTIWATKEVLWTYTYDL